MKNLEIPLQEKELAVERALSTFREKQLIVHQMFRNAEVSLNTRTIWNPNTTGYGLYVLDYNVYSSFILSVRYLGGTNDFLTSSGGVFMTQNGKYEQLWDLGGGVNKMGEPYKDAVFADVIGNETLANLKELGKGSIIDGYNAIREWLKSNCPTISYLFGNIASNPKGLKIDTGNLGFNAPWVDANGKVIPVQDDPNFFITNKKGNLSWAIPYTLRQIFLNHKLCYDSQFGIPEMSPEDMLKFKCNLENDFKALYNFDTASLRARFTKEVEAQFSH